MQDILLPLNCDDDSFSEDGALYKWSYYMIEAAQKLQRPLDAAKTHKQRLEESGFVDVHQVLHKWPQNSWAKQPKYKELGAWTMVNMLEGLQGLSMAPFTRGLGWTTQEVELFLVDVRRDVQNRAIHSYWPMYVLPKPEPCATPTDAPLQLLCLRQEARKHDLADSPMQHLACNIQHRKEVCFGTLLHPNDLDDLFERFAIPATTTVCLVHGCQVRHTSAHIPLRFSLLIQCRSCTIHMSVTVIQ